MPHGLVRIITNYDGEETGDCSWHLVDPSNPCGDAPLCSGEFFGEEEECRITFEVKHVKRGGITCLICLERLKAYKAIRL